MMKNKKFNFTVIAFLVVGFSLSAVAQNVSNYNEQGGARTVIGGSLDVVSGGEIDIEAGGLLKVAGVSVLPSFEDVTAANTLTADECGKSMTLNSGTEFASTLPAPSAGCKFKFTVKAAPIGADYTIATNAGANIMIGGINELEVDTGDDGAYQADADTISFKSGLSVAGDVVIIESDGTSWYFSGQVKNDGAIVLSSS